MKLSHAQPEIVNREAELRRPMGVGSGALLGIEFWWFVFVCIIFPVLVCQLRHKIQETKEQPNTEVTGTDPRIGESHQFAVAGFYVEETKDITGNTNESSKLDNFERQRK